MHIAITGASRGIGAAIAKQYGVKGNKLTLIARNKDALTQIADSLPCDVETFSVDLSLVDTCTDWVEKAEAQNGPIDILVNNAGIQIVQRPLEVQDEDLERMMNVNVRAPLLLTQKVAKGMNQRGGGSIVNLSSVAGIVATPGMCHYNASKSAIGAYSESLRFELKDTNVHVLTVYPGPVRTDMESAAREKLVPNWAMKNAPTGTPEKLAQLIEKAVQRKKTRVIYPQSYASSRFFPLFSLWITRMFTPKLR